MWVPRRRALERAVTDTIPDGLDLTSPDLYVERVPLEEFALLRTTRA